MSSGSVTLPVVGGGSGGITSINADVTPAQVIAAGTGISVATAAGTTTITNTSPSAATGNLTDTGTDGIVITGGTGAVIGTGTSLAQHVADATHNGYLSGADWSTFNAKQAALTIGNLTDVGTDGITVTSGTGAVIGTGTSIAQQAADASHNGYLASADWSTFNAKEPAISSGTTLQYRRGDKSFQTLDTAAVPENGNLYFTNARAQGAVSATAPLVDTAGVFSIPQSTTLVDGYLAATDWTTFNNKAPIDSPAFTGVPTAPTAAVGTSTTQIATTDFVLSQGFLGATGSMPSSNVSSTSAQTSATTTYVTAISTTLTVTASSAPIYAKGTGTFTVTSAVPTVMKYRISINGVAGQEQLLSLTALTTNYGATAQYISAGLAAGTYTILYELARNTGTGKVNLFEGTLDAIALQGTSSNGITSLSGLGLSAGPGSGAQSLTGTLTMAGGGTNASLTAANGAIPYSTASAFAFLAPGTAGQVLRSGGAGAPTWTSETFPASTTINQILYSSAANVVSGLATANTGALVTSSAGVPSITAGATANRLLRTNGTTVSFAQANLTTDVTGTLPFAQGGTGATAFANQRVPFSNGTTFTTDALFTYDTTNTILSVGGSGSAKINAIVTSGSHTALQAFNSSGGNAFQSTNVSAWTSALISRQNNATTGASLSFEFGRGTPASPTGALNGDQVGVIAGLPDAAVGAAFGYCGAISFVASEDATTTATGGELVLSTTPNGNVVPVERFRVKNSGESVFAYAIRAAQYTTAAKTALTAATGWVVYDTDLNQLSYYNGTTWINL